MFCAFRKLGDNIMQIVNPLEKTLKYNICKELNTYQMNANHESDDFEALMIDLVTILFTSINLSLNTQFNPTKI